MPPMLRSFTTAKEITEAASARIRTTLTRFPIRMGDMETRILRTVSTTRTAQEILIRMNPSMWFHRDSLPNNRFERDAAKRRAPQAGR